MRDSAQTRPSGPNHSTKGSYQALRAERLHCSCTIKLLPWCREVRLPLSRRFVADGHQKAIGSRADDLPNIADCAAVGILPQPRIKRRL
ncbi:hypothetical protein SBBP2_1620004 [Burkholderiales bacterium]|nr:hypothetical protein SBBP2_1620004 [Burkholderiales bacterium]